MRLDTPAVLTSGEGLEEPWILAGVSVQDGSAESGVDSRSNQADNHDQFLQVLSGNTYPRALRAANKEPAWLLESRGGPDLGELGRALD